jgi:hypothetical protein
MTKFKFQKNNQDLQFEEGVSFLEFFGLTQYIYIYIRITNISMFGNEVNKTAKVTYDILTLRSRAR